MTDDSPMHLNRRTMLKGAIASVATLPAAAAFAARAGDLRAVKQAVDAGFEESIRRIQQWINLPTIAAEQLNVEQGAEYMAQLARDAGFRRVRKVFTDLPLRKPFNQFGVGTGGRAHAPDEYYLIESNTPKVAGLREAAKAHAEFLYEMASGKKS